jgi:hypothetical protein
MIYYNVISNLLQYNIKLIYAHSVRVIAYYIIRKFLGWYKLDLISILTQFDKRLTIQLKKKKGFSVAG